MAQHAVTTPHKSKQIRLPVEEMKNRLILGQKMAEISQQAYTQGMEHSGSAFLARQQATLAREAFAQEHGIKESQRDDHMALAKLVEDLDLDEIKYVQWEVLRNLRFNYVNRERARKLVRLFAHSEIHPGCPNAIPNNGTTCLIYNRTEDPNLVNEINNKYDALLIELQSEEYKIDQELRSNQLSIQRFIQQRKTKEQAQVDITPDTITINDRVITPAISPETIAEWQQALQNTVRNTIHEVELDIDLPQETEDKIISLIQQTQHDTVITPILDSVKTIGPGLQEMFEQAVTQIAQQAQERISAQRETILALTKNLESKDGQMDILKKLIDEEQRRTNSLINERDHMIQYRERLQEDYEKLQRRSAAMTSEWEVVRAQKEEMEQQVSFLNSHVQTLAQNQQSYPALIDMYKEQLASHKEFNQELQEKLRLAITRNDELQNVNDRLRARNLALADIDKDK